ncbi:MULTISPECIES: PfkB family carbohydrate kinase [unclassified Roseitalea]|uniref:carbohydrate kinase family protein n=1 Tax=unclassified Roseitalea TaxID=2639107 RepID=UPI00273F3AC4|nr:MULTISPECIES: PfkB family carbohydrate kinase [unclassified Roseitalea]
MSAKTPKPAVLSVGRLYCDLIFTDVPRLPSTGTEVYAGDFGIHAGGGAFITAAHLASLGHRTALASYIPGAPFHDVVTEELRDAELDIGLCRPLGAQMDPQLTVAIAVNGDRAFLTRRSGPALPDIDAGDLGRLGVAHLHVGELATLVERPDLIAMARQAGATISLDCSWDDDIAPPRVIAALIERVDVFLPNEAEARRLADLGVPARCAPLTAIKKGADGAAVLAAGTELTEPAQPVHAVDTTGAGDAFNAGFLSAWLGGEPLQACLRAGNALGARAIAGRGGFHRSQARDEDTFARTRQAR